MDGKAKYVLRFVVFSGHEVDTILRGYGVTLDIKNMEYKNLDDSVSSKTLGDDSSTEDSVESSQWMSDKDEDVEGFHLLYPTLS